MRKFIDIVTEAPIADMEFSGYGSEENTPFDQGTSFGKVDRALLTSEKAQKKIVRAFRNTPHVFEIIFLNRDDIDGDDDEDNDDISRAVKKVRAGISDGDFGVEGEAGKIKVILMGNLSANDPIAPKMPMTAWTIAHKIGHAFQDHVAARGYVNPIGELIGDVNHSMNFAAGTGREMGVFSYHPNMASIMTMKSARTGKISNDFELFPEIIAQYLIKGRVVLNLPDDRKKECEDRLNGLIRALFAEVTGKVLIDL